MFERLRFLNEAGTIIIAESADGRLFEIDQAQDPRFSLIRNGVVKDDGSIVSVDDYVAPEPPTPEQVLADERRVMSTTVPFLRIAIHRAGQTATAETALSAYPEQEIIWCAGGKVSRLGFVSQALQSAFTDADIDAFFRDAMTIKL